MMKIVNIVLLWIFLVSLVSNLFSTEKVKIPNIYPYGGKVIQDTLLEWETDDILFFGEPGDISIETPTDSAVVINWVLFDSSAVFTLAQFDSVADFFRAQFDGKAFFDGVQFKSRADFRGVLFDSSAVFTLAQFDSTAVFRRAQFDGDADFDVVQFKSRADFIWADFYGRADFAGAKFYGRADFTGAKFYDWASFRGARFDTTVDFSGATIESTLLIGTYSIINKYDFSKVGRLGRNAHISIAYPVDLVMQLEKLEYLSFHPGLDYYSKKDIITVLKNISFNGEQYQKERFELDYLLAQSIKYQDVSTEYKPNKWYQIHKWPKWIIIFLYDITMGLGYRPFRIVPWFFVILIVFSFWIFMAMPDSINAYLNRDEKKKKQDIPLSTFINCFYVSAAAFLGIRLNKDVLTFFEPKDRFRIVFIWAVGLLVYFYFLYGAKSGSIANTIKGLF